MILSVEQSNILVATGHVPREGYYTVEDLIELQAETIMAMEVASTQRDVATTAAQKQGWRDVYKQLSTLRNNTLLTISFLLYCRKHGLKPEIDYLLNETEVYERYTAETAA